MAGGKGTRIASVYSDIPKPMIPVLGKPILEYAIESLQKQGNTEIILIIGHLGSIIADYFGDGSKFGVSIEYITEQTPLGTAGALYFLKDRLKEDFLLLNGDIIFDIDVQRFYDRHKKCGGIATLFTHPNDHPYDSGIIVADENACVKNWLHKEDQRRWYKNRVNAGIHMISPEIFQTESGKKLFCKPRKTDLDRELLKPLISTGQLFVYDSSEYVRDMGTPDRLLSVTADISSGKVRGKNRKQKQKAVFLDRDGTINKYVGFLKRMDEFELLPGVAQAVRAINESGYLAIVITNQPVIARGEVTKEGLREIHNKMETLLGENGAYLDGIYYCPHHPDKGYEGEIPELKIKCQCRKPGIGLFLKAAEDFHIDLTQSWMVGDGENDILAGKTAGCRTALISDAADTKKFGQTMTVASLLEFTENGEIMK